MTPLTAHEQQQWKQLRLEGYKVEQCGTLVTQNGKAWRWYNPIEKGFAYLNRNAAIRDCIKRKH